MKLLPEITRALLGLTVFVCLISCGARSVVEDEMAKSNGKLTIIEFTDYGCTHCQDLHARLAPLLEEQQGAVRLVIKHVPLPEHAGAKRAAEAAICAEAQDKLPPVHDALMKGAGKGDDDLIDLAQHAGLDIEAFKACLRSDVPRDRLDKDLKDYRAAGADGLPMVFFDTTKLVDIQSEEALRKALKDHQH